MPNRSGAPMLGARCTNAGPLPPGFPRWGLSCQGLGLPPMPHRRPVHRGMMNAVCPRITGGRQPSAVMPVQGLICGLAVICQSLPPIPINCRMLRANVFSIWRDLMSHRPECEISQLQGVSL